MWECKHCKEEVEDNFDICWNCGKAKYSQPSAELPDEESNVFQEVSPAPRSETATGGNGNLVCKECQITRSKTDPDVTKEGRSYRCSAGHTMMKVPSPVIMFIIYALFAPVIITIIRLGVALLTDEDAGWVIVIIIALLSVPMIISGAKKLETPIKILGKSQLGIGLGLLTGIVVTAILELLSLPGPLS